MEAEERIGGLTRTGATRSHAEQKNSIRMAFLFAFLEIGCILLEMKSIIN
jgi:hypothetical protein